MAFPESESNYSFGAPLTTPEILQAELMSCDSARQYVNELVAQYIMTPSEIVLRTVSETIDRERAKQFYRGGILGLRAIAHELGEPYAETVIGSTVPTATIRNDMTTEEKRSVLWRSLEGMGAAGLRAEPEYEDFLDMWNNHLVSNYTEAQLLRHGLGFVLYVRTLRQSQLKALELDDDLACMAEELIQAPTTDWDAALADITE
ncbi:hypothetical protein H7Y63_03675 [Polaromonas sp.]|nr:hypothetical protein [Candidatus Saccharibacteria bacterium]